MRGPLPNYALYRVQCVHHRRDRRHAAFPPVTKRIIHIFLPGGSEIAHLRIFTITAAIISLPLPLSSNPRLLKVWGRVIKFEVAEILAKLKNQYLATMFLIYGKIIFIRIPENCF